MTTTTINRRDPAVAGILSFLWAGLGNIYNGSIGKGIAFAVATFFGWFLIIPGLVLWIWAIFNAYQEAERINKRLDRAEMRHAPAQPFANLHKAERSYTADSDAFIQRLDKLVKLYEAHVLEMEEFNERKAVLIDELALHSGKQDPDTFMAELIPAIDRGILVPAEVQEIKDILY